MRALNPSDIGISSEDLDRAYVTALLLTGSAEAAEGAVLAGITAMEEDNLSGESLLWESIGASIAIATSGNREIELPPALRRVVCLPRRLRDAFVLRVLVNVPLGVCARILDTNVNQVDARVRVAAQALANSEE